MGFAFYSAFFGGQRGGKAQKTGWTCIDLVASWVGETPSGTGHQSPGSLSLGTLLRYGTCLVGKDLELECWCSSDNERNAYLRMGLG